MIVDGAWQFESRGRQLSLEDRNTHKGKSSITVPLRVARAGTYQVYLLYRHSGNNADNVLVELYAAGSDDRLAAAVPTTPAEPGIASYYYDCGDDAQAFFQPDAWFQFADGDYVEVANRGTRQRVTAGAVEFIEQNPKRRFTIDSLAAIGSDRWQPFNEGNFRAYNVKGTKLHDNNAKKGELTLRYQLEIPKHRWGAWSWPKQNPPEPAQGQTAWDSNSFYRVRIYYPGKANQRHAYRQQSKQPGRHRSSSSIGP